MMKSNRRKFLQYSGLTGIGLAIADIKNAFGGNHNPNRDALFSGVDKKHGDHFNMCGYAAPKLETVRIGFIGLGNRGPAAVERMRHIEGEEIKALGDIRSEKLNAVKTKLQSSVHKPTIYGGKEEEWKKLCEQPDIDLVYIA